ncbi:Putative Flp/Fap pilin component [Bradyrhizobium sp. ORS 278]|uniref:Flp family type IVb pilin n=1 Tax=Bradyrhizobium sp. (strain ORS 278) TaxID=114615 RepID=UPI0001508529|nr:Flp family type IVb pilin [Bradyrhizobium sp. ORS 278]CAL76538.1 Putative Flp/Fap pilin component [Bradyrhizobium sp. ORS 278]
MRQLIASFLRHQAGATSIEYAIIAGGLSIVILAAVNGLGSGLSSKFTSINSSIK